MINEPGQDEAASALSLFVFVRPCGLRYRRRIRQMGTLASDLAMRLAVALIATSMLAGPAWAEDPPSAIKQGIDAAINVGYVEQNCPKYRVDRDKLRSFMNARAVTPADFNKYAGYVHYLQNAAQTHPNLTQDQFCDSLASVYGEHGTFPNLISRR